MRFAMSLLTSATAITLALCPSIAEAEPITLYDTVGNGQFNPGAYQVFLADVFPAFPFVPSTTATLSSVELAISRVRGPSSTARVTMYAAHAGLPGQVLEEIPAFLTYDWVDFNPPPPITATSALMPVLKAGQEYWVAASIPHPQGVGAWGINTVGHQGPSALWSDGVWHYRPAAPDASFTTTAFRVIGVSDAAAVPEPTSVILLSLGIGGALIRRFRA